MLHVSGMVLDNTSPAILGLLGNGFAVVLAFAGYGVNNFVHDISILVFLHKIKLTRAVLNREYSLVMREAAKRTQPRKRRERVIP